MKYILLKYINSCIIKTLLLFVILIISALSSYGQNSIQEKASSFAASTGATTTIDEATNSITYIRFSEDKLYNIKGGSNVEKSLNFMTEQAALFSMRDKLDALILKEQVVDLYGLENVSLQQTYMGVPVFSGLLKYHYNQNGKLLSLNGNYIKEIKVNPVPSISKQQAGAIAKKLLLNGKLTDHIHPVAVKNVKLYIFQKGLAQGYHGTKHLVYETELTNGWDVREFLYIDAHDGTLVEQFTGIHGIDRRIYESSTNAGNLKWKEGDAFPGNLDASKQAEVETTGHVYNFFNKTFGYTSFNNKDATMVVVDKSTSIGCPNATWNGISANFCEGTAADDAIAHEWAHAYTEYTSGLIYAYQSGAMNEAYSDIWGETIDLLNNYQDENENNSLRTGCGSSQRWIIGEKVTSMAGGNGLRDMWDPTCKSAPGKISDPQFYCGTGDNGGVHRNSGVLNHAYALLVDGGTYNGQHIKGIGITKAAHVFWRAQTAYMTPTTDYMAQADILESSLADLLGLELKSLTTTSANASISEEIISKADALELKKVLLAVEMRLASNCTSNTALLQPVAEICNGGKPENAFFFENFENGLGNWAVTNNSTSPSWILRDWIIKDFGPGGRISKVAFATDNTGGNCGSSSQNGIINLTSPLVVIPENTSGSLLMAFDHYVSIESGYDGGNLSYRINEGPWALIPASAFTDNPYNRANLISVGAGNNNPLAGQPAFSGNDGGTISGSWGQSRIDLSTLGLQAGQSIQLRWQLGTDGCNGYDGWYIDDVRLYTCALPSLQFDTSVLIINEGEAATAILGAPCDNFSETIFKFKVNSQPSKPVTIILNQTGGSAVHGENADFTISPMQFQLSDSHMEQTITIRVFNDGITENEETIELNYSFSNPEGGNALAANDSQALQIKIIDDNFAPAVTSHHLLQADFNTGLPLGWSVSNSSASGQSWQLNNDPDIVVGSNNSLMLVNSNASAYGFQPINTSLVSAPFSGMNLSSINLSFKEFFNPYLGINDFDEQAIVEVWDGQNWYPILTQNESTGVSGSWSNLNLRNVSIPIEYASPAMRIRFRYEANFDFWWAIDDVNVQGESIFSAQEIISSNAAQQYLGPNQTVYFKDPDSNDLIAKIENLSNHDYGCTAIVVDGEGTNSKAWINNYRISNKTIKVIPTNNNPNGRYEITMYYSNKDLGTFKGSEIKAIGKCENGISNSNASNTSWAVITQTYALGENWAFSAIFDSGFSGFGLSDITASGPLPVVLSSFTVKNSVEGNQLTWITSIEQNHDYFSVERSTDGKDFHEIGILRNQDFRAVSSGNLYYFLDPIPNNPTSYYRLKSFDMDGSYAFSSIVVVTSKTAVPFMAYPNPASGKITLSLKDWQKANLTISIFNLSGQLMSSETVDGYTQSTYTKNLKFIPNGKYVIQITNGIQTESTTFIKQ